MEVRLNKLISDSGLCSRREADKFIEEGRVTVNGSLPHIGQKVTEADIVMLDDIQVRIGKHTGKQTSSARINIQELELAGQEKKAKKKKDKKDEQIEELTDRVKRQMAEFENFRKRTEKEKSQMYDMGAKSIVEKILPVIDNFERGLAAVPEDAKDDPFVDGMNKIYKQMISVLEEAGVKAIEAEGKEFDPDFHNAVMHVEDESLGENIVAEELQKGYMYRDTVVRHSMVKVAN